MADHFIYYLSATLHKAIVAIIIMMKNMTELKLNITESHL